MDVIRDKLIEDAASDGEADLAGVHDLATILLRFGIDHDGLTDKHPRRHYRLTDLHLDRW